VRAAITSSVNAIPYTQSEAFCRYIIVSDARSFVVRALGDAPAGAPGLANGYEAIGLYVDGVLQPAHVLTSLGRIYDKTYELAAGSKTLELVFGPAGVEAIGGTPVRSCPVLGYNLTKGASHSVTAPSAPAKRIVVMGDSLSQGVMPTAPPNQAAVYQSWTILMRANALASGAGSFAGAHLINAGYSGAQWADECSTAGKITASLARLAQWLDGTGSNILVTALGTNDWGSGVSAANMQTNLGAWADAFNAAHPTVTVVVCTPVTRTGETTPNAGGATLPQIRTAMANVVAARPGFMTLVNGPPLVTYPTNFYSDLIHLNTAGMVQFEASLRAALGIY